MALVLTLTMVADDPDNTETSVTKSDITLLAGLQDQLLTVTKLQYSTRKLMMEGPNVGFKVNYKDRKAIQWVTYILVYSCLFLAAYSVLHNTVHCYIHICVIVASG